MPAEGNSGTLKPLTEQYIAEMHSRVMSPYPMRGTGAVWVIFDPPLAGATVELDAATGVRFYLDEESNWYPDLTATTARGRGGVTEVTPGEVQVNVRGTADNCSIAFGWPSHGENSVRLPVREGYVTAVNMRCTTR